MKIEVGEYYLSANCNIVKIIKHNPNIGIFVSNIDILHKSNGRVENGFIKEFDLIAHIPKQLLNYIVFVTELYHTNNDMKQMIDTKCNFTEDMNKFLNEKAKNEN